jgi:single-strand DNA-binding protein
MNPINNILIEGNACRDPELKHSKTGADICKISLAVDRYYKSNDGFEKEVSFFDVETFGLLAKTCAEKCRKGVGLRVVGRLRQSRWTGSDGVNRSNVVIIAEHVEFRQRYSVEPPHENTTDNPF